MLWLKAVPTPHLPIIEISNTDNEADYLEISSFKMFVSKTKTYYCKSRTHFAAYGHRYGNGGWVN